MKGDGSGFSMVGIILHSLALSNDFTRAIALVFIRYSSPIYTNFLRMISVNSWRSAASCTNVELWASAFSNAIAIGLHHGAHANHREDIL